MIWIQGIDGRFGSSDELRVCGREAGFLNNDDYSTSIVYIGGWVGFDINDELPDEAVENALSDVLADKLGVSNPTYGFEVDADHPDYEDKREELMAYFDGTHPNLNDTS